MEAVDAGLFEPLADLARFLERVPSLAQGKSVLASSIALILNCRWKSAPTSLRIARTTSSGKRARFSSEPPYSSVRSLIAGLRNWVMR